MANHGLCKKGSSPRLLWTPNECRLLESIARNIAGEATLRTLAADVAGAVEATINPKTVATYMSALTRVFALDELPAWSVSLRSLASSSVR